MQPNENFLLGNGSGSGQRAIIGQPTMMTMAQLSTINAGYGIGSSTSSIGRVSAPIMSEDVQRMRSDSQDSQIRLTGNDGMRRSADAQELNRQMSEAMTSNKQGSGQRKRSRLQEEGNIYVKEGLSKKESQAKKTQIDSTIQVLYSQIEQVFSKGERGKTMISKSAIQETLRVLGFDVFQLLAAVVNLQEEKAALHYQVIQLQAQNLSSEIGEIAHTGTPATNTYLQAAMLRRTASNVAEGKRLPIPEIPRSLKHAPSEKVLIFKAAPAMQGMQQTKQQQEDFRNEVNTVIGEDLMDGIDVIRPTRNGGHTIIFQTEQARGKVLEIFRENEKNAEVDESRSCIIAPKKKNPKVVCRDPPENVSMDAVLNEFYGKNNIHLFQIPRAHRDAKIISTRFGWIFEISSMEAAAIQAQGGRIRYGNARELRVEEYIPLQQCYNCCSFRHNAKNCTSDISLCRLCGKTGHAGWDCAEKENRANWKCINCILNNETKGLQLPINHAAAQLHKCPCAQNHKEIRKLQLAAAGVYTTPIINENIIDQNRREINVSGQLATKGPQRVRSNEINAKKTRSRSRRRATNQQTIVTSQTMQPTSSTSTSASSAASSSTTRFLAGSNTQAQNETMNEVRQMTQRNKTFRVQRPRSYDGWKTVGRPRENEEAEEVRGRNLVCRKDGTSDRLMGDNIGAQSPKDSVYDDDAK